MTRSARHLILGLLLAAAAPAMALGEAAPATRPLTLDEIITLALSAPEAASPPPTMQIAALSDNELDGYRGGYSPAPNLDFQFGAVVRTFEDGQLALETSLNLNSQTGMTVQQTAGPGVTPGAALGDLTLAGATGGVYSTPGGTTFIQNLANGQLANVILNTDSNRTFRQETDVTLVLPGFADVQNQMVRNLTGLRLSMDAAAGTVRSLSH